MIWVAEEPVTHDQDCVEYGEAVFYGLHHGGNVPALWDECAERLKKRGFRGWGLLVSNLPLAKGAYLALCDHYNVRPEIQDR